MMLIGTYQLLKEIGKGGISKVYLGVKRGKPYAIKVLSPESTKRKEVVDGFIREIRILSKLKHPQIPKILDEGKANTLHFAAMELIVGISLDDFPRPLPLPLALYVIRQCCEVMRYLHSTTVFENSSSIVFHGDLSPSNLMLSKDGRLTLIDFGSAGQESPADPKDRHLGKLYYLPPEILKGKPFSKSADLYALGVIAFEMLFGRRPFEASTRLELVNVIAKGEIPRLDTGKLVNEQKDESALRIFFNRVFHREIDSRFKTVEEFEREFFKVRFTSSEAKSGQEATGLYPSNLRERIEGLEQEWSTLVNASVSAAQADHMKYTEVQSMLANIDRRRHPRIGVIDSAMSAEVFSLNDRVKLQCEIHELSQNGMLLKWEGLIPKVGEEYPISFQLGAGPTIQTKGRVTYEVSRNSKPFAGLELVGLSNVDRKRLADFVSEKMCDSKSTERISSGLKILEVTYPTQKDYDEEYERNIRFGGMCMTWHEPVEIYAQVIVRIEIPGRLDRMALKGVVISCVPVGNRFTLGIQIEAVS